MNTERITDVIKKYYKKSVEIFYKILYCLLLIYFVGVLFVGYMNYSKITLGKNDISFIFYFTEFSLTLGGFTLISSIFTKKDKYSKIELNLFQASRNFLLSAFLFIVFLGLSYIPTDISNYRELQVFAVIALIAGFIIFIFGFYDLIKVLTDYADEIYRTLDEEKRNH